MTTANTLDASTTAPCRIVISGASYEHLSRGLGCIFAGATNVYAQERPDGFYMATQPAAGSSMNMVSGRDDQTILTSLTRLAEAWLTNLTVADCHRINPTMPVSSPKTLSLTAIGWRLEGMIFDRHDVAAKLVPERVVVKTTVAS